jgi:tetratricopeptide (TPR) repeat protein
LWPRERLCYQQGMWFPLAVLLCAIPDVPVPGLEEAYALEEAGQLPEALYLFSGLASQHPQVLKLRYEAARVGLKLGTDLAAVEKELTVARTLAPQEPQVLMLWGLLLEEQGKPWRAISVLEEALTKLPADAETRFRLGGLYLEVGDLLRSEYHYRKLAKERPDWVHARLQLAIVLERQERHDEARTELLALRELHPDSVKVTRSVAEFFARRGENAEAQELQKVIGEPPQKKMRVLPKSKR